MLNQIKTQLQNQITQALKEAYPEIILPLIELEGPTDPQHGDFASNIALKAAKVLRKPPLQIAQDFQSIIQKSFESGSLKGVVSKIEVKNPGFINFYLSTQAFYQILENVFQENQRYGFLTLGGGKKIQIEFVSANPTGPLTVAHGRQAAVGDVLGNILAALGFEVAKEYYINDRGNQINILGLSIKCRAIEILGGFVTFPEDGYQGDYIKDIAQEFLVEKNVKSVDQIEKFDVMMFRQFGIDYLLNVIKEDLEDFGVRFDVWSSETKIASDENIRLVLDQLASKGFTKEEEGALWFKSTMLGDDKDRVLRKSEGSFTYLTPDIVYHKNKFDRGFDKVINIWGPDHHGYIPRIKAAVEALGRNKEALDVLIVQLATIYRDGKPISMSTRRGQFISLREVMDEVGADAARFFFLMRHISGHLDFDLELAKKETPENPVYYIQYAHARTHSINKKAQEANVKAKQSNFKSLKEVEEIDLIKKLGSFSDSLLFCYHQLDPYPLISYMQELATAFHRFYDYHRVVDQNQELSAERLGLVNATRIVLANGLRLLSVSVPEQM